MVKFSLVSESVLDSVFDLINRKIVELKRNYKVVKVGITKKKPHDCYQEHLKDSKWKRFIVIYENDSPNCSHFIKDQLIECHFFDDKVPESKFNCISQDLIMTYVYVLLK